jgi:hypothetical protein
MNMTQTNIRNKVYRRDQLWSNSKGRDYIKVGDEIWSINGLYCLEDGTLHRWGSHVTVIDVRWPVLIHRQYDGKLEYVGDAHDDGALRHWGYTWPEMDSGEEVWRHRLGVTPPAK